MPPRQVVTGGNSPSAVLAFLSVMRSTHLPTIGRKERLRRAEWAAPGLLRGGSRAMSQPFMPIAYLVLLMTHFLGLALAVGASFALLTLRRASAQLESGERVKFMLRALGVSKNGSVGLLLLLVSGLGMFFMRGPGAVLAAGGPPFHAKLTLVVILCGVFGYSQVLSKRAREAGGGPALAKLPRVSMAILLLGVAIVISAVLAFQ